MKPQLRARLLLAALLLALATLGCGNLSPESRTLDGIQHTIQEATQ
jgi:hypothetical protein